MEKGFDAGVVCVKKIMKKIFVIASKNSFNFVRNVLSSKNIDFTIWDDEYYKKQKEMEKYIVDNDIALLKNENFNAQLFQSVEKDIQTRLLIPNNFDSLDEWNKKYTLMHELGHYFSMNKNSVEKYYDFLEKNKLIGQLYNIPLEVEAEKYVFMEDKKLFKNNANEIYYNYYQQLKDNIDGINQDNMNERNFEQIFEIRLFRYDAIIESVLNRGTATYKRHKSSLKKIETILKKKGDYFKGVIDNMDNLNQALDDLNLNESFDSYCNICRENYRIFNIEK